MATVKDILSMTRQQVASMDIEHMRAALGVLRDAGNKRLQRLEESGLAENSIAYQNLVNYWQDNPRFKTDKNWSRNQVYSEFTRAYNFLKNKTSTNRGTKQVSAKAYQRVTGEKSGTWTKRGEERQFWDEYNRYARRMRQSGQTFDSEQIQRAIKIVQSRGIQFTKSNIDRWAEKLPPRGEDGDSLPY